jgi:hypothetical protein
LIKTLFPYSLTLIHLPSNPLLARYTFHTTLEGFPQSIDDGRKKFATTTQFCGASAHTDDDSLTVTSPEHRNDGTCRPTVE